MRESTVRRVEGLPVFPSWARCYEAFFEQDFKDLYGALEQIVQETAAIGGRRNRKKNTDA